MILSLNLDIGSIAPAPEPRQVGARADGPGGAAGGNSELQEVAVERAHAGYSGAGYLANREHPGQRVRFDVELPPGAYVAFARDVAAGADVTRLVRVDGEPPRLVPFPRSARWDRWLVRQIPFRATRPVTTLSFEIDERSGASRSGFLNLDRLVIRRERPGRKDSTDQE